MLETIFQLDLELAYADLQIARLLQRRGQVNERKRKRRVAARTVWVRSWLLDRDEDGQFRLLMDKLRLHDVQAFKNFTRMDPDFFFHLLEKLRPNITKKDTNYRKAIPPALRLALTLRYYASGDSYMSLRYNWLVAHNTVSKIIREVSKAIIQVYGIEEQVIMPPMTTEGWLAVERKFSRRWNFHHTLGALDGKHIPIRKPGKSGSLYYNYKGFFSIVLLALVDGNYKFLWVDVGSNGAASDAQVFNSGELKEMIQEGLLNIPPPDLLPEEPFPDVPYFFIGDDAFALKTWMMKPYSKRDMTMEEFAFNYRLSRARRIVENAFGILSNRFGCLMRTQRVTPQTATDITLACCILHNLLRDVAPIPRGLVDEEDADHNLVPGSFREHQLTPAGVPGDSGRNTGSTVAKIQRDFLKDYYNSDVGKVEWQDRALKKWKED